MHARYVYGVHTNIGTIGRAGIGYLYELRFHDIRNLNMVLRIASATVEIDLRLSRRSPLYLYTLLHFCGKPVIAAA